MNNLIDCKSLKFSLKEKIITQCGFHGGILIGAYGLYLSHSYAIAYLLFSYIGISLLMRFTVCPRCPHLFDGNDRVAQTSSKRAGISRQMWPRPS